MENNQPPSSSGMNVNASAPQESYVHASTSNATPNSKHSRVTSTVAQSFGAELDSMFGLSAGGAGGGSAGAAGGGVDVLSQNVEERKKDVSTGQSELEQLEAKLRETEQRLARVSRQNSPSRQPQATTGSNNNKSALRGEGEQRQPHPLAQKPTFPADRPPTGSRQDTQQIMKGMPGAMPGTPAEAQGQGQGRGEDYVMVDDGRGR